MGGFIIKYQTQFKRRENDLLNEAIRFQEFTLIDEDGTNLGKFSKKKALDLAIQKDLDVYIVSPSMEHPVAKLMNYSKYQYEEQKKKRESLKNQKVMVVKEIRFTPVTEENDLNTKLKQARKFLEDGNKIKISIRLMKRMMVKVDLGKEVLQKFLDSLKDLIVIEQPIKHEGKMISSVVAPISKKLGGVKNAEK